MLRVSQLLASIVHIRSSQLILAARYDWACQGTLRFLHPSRVVPIHKHAIWTSQRASHILLTDVSNHFRPPLEHMPLVFGRYDCLCENRSRPTRTTEYRFSRFRPQWWDKAQAIQVYFFSEPRYCSWVIVSTKSITPLPEKVKAIHEWPAPHCLRDVRTFYGLSSLTIASLSKASPV